MPNILQYEQRTSPDVRGFGQSKAYAPRMEGVGIGAAADALNAFMENYNKRQEEQARAWVAGALSEARLTWTAQLVNYQENSEPGAPDFSRKFIGDYDKYSEKLIAGAPSESARKYLSERMMELRSQLGEKAITFEAGARVDYRNDMFNKAIDNSQKTMNTDPGMYEVVLAERLVEIESSMLPPKAKSAMREKAIEKISEAAVWSQINRSPMDFLNSVGVGTYGAFGVGPTVINAKTGEVIEQGNIGDVSNPNKPKGPMGVTGNKPFDMLPFDKRIEFITKALTTKNQLDTAVDRAAEQDRKLTADHYMKEIITRANPAKPGDPTLDRAYVEEAKQWLTPTQYESAMRMLRGDDSKDSDPSVYQHLLRILYSGQSGAADAAMSEAYRSHKNRLLSSSDLNSILNKGWEISRQSDPKTAYERTTKRIVGNLDPGPFVQDPVGRARLSEAVYEFDSWVQGKKRTDEEIEKKGEEIIKRYRLWDPGKLLPKPVNPKGVSMREKELNAVGAEWNKVKADYAAKRITEQQYRDASVRLRNKAREIEMKYKDEQ
jgi:hypothetical protein